ncbi:hypothetical protein VTJ83DRAFT_213 [Remersonia thermophila]|uniref:STB6-like N-terminal domain-containing protein n=1 Tax=Remersonia thermophila TaxID=72144 RepID=A0ABR4DM73_9PEZI
MSFKLPFPTAVDGRVHREEELTLARLASHHQRLAKDAAASSEPRAAGSTAMASAPPTTAVPIPANRRRVVLPDPVAFRFLGEDPSGSVLVAERRRVLPGYELYLVEQWACSRESPTVVIATYTGDPKHTIVVGVLEIPADAESWSPRVRYYFGAMQKYHARPKETELGELMVTNLSSFPSALTVIPVPEGDIRKHRRDFMVNENLKRLGCSGRSGLTLTDPTPATQAKFMQMYKTSDRRDFKEAVLELVRLCQVALFLFGMLDEEFIDGLLCDVTERAVNDWWAKIGSEFFTEPSDGILGPTTVAALLGTLLGARNRLSSYGAPVSKDAFDTESTKKGIGTFQKSMRMPRTRRLDRETLLRLRRVTAKAAAGDGGWGVQKAVKSTVAEIGGKRGEIVIGMVGGRDKANIGDIETSDLGRFVSLAYGEQPKWLWHGKPRRTAQQPEQPDPPLSAFGRELRDEVGSPAGAASSWRAQSVPLEEELERKREDAPPTSVQPPTVHSPSPAAETPADRDALRKTVFKSVAGKVSDARSGLGRIRDAVGGGLRGHAYRPSKDETSEMAGSGYTSPIAMLAQSSAALTSPATASKAFPWKPRPDDDLSSATPEGGSAGTGAPSLPSIQESERTDHALVGRTKAGARGANPSATSSDAADAGEPHDLALFGERGPEDRALLALQRRRSLDCLASLERRPNEARFPRRLSFSAAEDAVLGWTELVSLADAAVVAAAAAADDDDDDADADNAAAAAAALSAEATAAAAAARTEISRRLFCRLQGLQSSLGPWVCSQVSAISSLSQLLDAQRAEAQALHSAAEEACDRAQHGAREAVVEERARLADAVKDVEVLAAKLEYEIGALVSRVAEVEDGVRMFEVQVKDVERRADELKRVLETESWLHWFVRTLTGIGTGPNITREG